MRSPFDLGYPQLLLAAIALGTVLAVGVAASTSAAGFGAFNPGWDGASDLRSAAEADGAEPFVVRDVDEYDSVATNDSIALVLSPDERYDDRDAARLREYVENGGTLVVADDFGDSGNALLADLGARARVDGRPLRDERRHYRSPALPLATNVSNRSLPTDVQRLTLNHGTAVRPNGTTVLATTSAYAYFDGNRNDELDDSETLSEYPVATAESVGDGRVVVVGDPSLFINAMLDRPGNRAFVRGLFGSADRVLLDYSHSEHVPPLMAALISVQRSSVLQILLGTTGVIAIAAWAQWPTAGRRVPSVSSGESQSEPPELSADDVATAVRDRHPDWNDERVRRVTQAIMERRIERENNG
ncbi:DUF4350 domain-containing protein [Halostella sp. PRR32]|uniref:DUF4350 domain-containing protein n=1 Tax=Halostella sp. PRR32 TaxID=3098147 RepID=UPI002B1E8C96|nr:DUF4350 domain-containing protein [Halostella sp. PRR32]